MNKEEDMMLLNILLDMQKGSMNKLGFAGKKGFTDETLPELLKKFEEDGSIKGFE